LEPVRDHTLSLPPEFVWQPYRKFKDRRWLHALLLLLTVGTTTVAGIGNWVQFAATSQIPYQDLEWTALVIRGFWYSATILAILGCHELGHYLACRYYDVDASLPYFLPLPLPVMTGTLGAFIRIREPIPSKRILFDIGIAGPLAGFVVAVPALFIGLSMSKVVPFPPFEAVGFFSPSDGVSLGEPVLFKLAAWLMAGRIGDGYTYNLHPVAFAAWFGMLATFLNLFPIAQLDGGHISYAVFGRHSSRVTLAALGGVALMTVFSPGLWLWAGLMVVMLLRFGRHHPSTFDEDVPLDSTRKLMAVLALVMFVLCFMPAPIQPIHLLR
jgi:membrane-associated protease RseP (regulator of RpoE activity)